MNPDQVLKILGYVLDAAGIVAGGIKLVLHFTGADAHKTIAGDVADALQAGSTTIRKHLNGVEHGTAQDVPS